MLRKTLRGVPPGQKERIAHPTPENRLRGLTEALETLPGGSPPDSSWAGRLVLPDLERAATTDFNDYLN
jgi:hypothetical protein